MNIAVDIVNDLLKQAEADLSDSKIKYGPFSREVAMDTMRVEALRDAIEELKK